MIKRWLMLSAICALLTGQAFAAVIGSVPPNGNIIRLTGVGTSLAITATTLYFPPTFGLAANATQATGSVAAPATETITSIWCGMTAANGSGTTDTFTLVDSTTACTSTPVTCTASNSVSCSAAGLSCPVTAGDVIAIKDVTTGTPAARAATCTVSP